jgi:DNA-binding NtrC family response regulator
MIEKTGILLVDDNISLCTTLSFILKRKGYEVAIANNGMLAIEKIRENPFDIILMDIKMPVLNGVETYKQIKKIHHEALVIMMTAYTTDDLIQKALDEGVFRIIYKPLDTEKIINIIAEAANAKKNALVLIVDDDPGTCLTLKNILTKKGYQTHFVMTGEEAIKVLKESVFDIILIDLKLPTINGLETYLAIREISKEVEVIMMTGFFEETEFLVKAALNNHAYTCLYKPIDIDILYQSIKDICTKKMLCNKKGVIYGK